MKTLRLIFALFLFSLSLLSQQAGKDDYYDGFDFDQSSASLKSALTTLVSTNHTNLPYTSGSTDTWDALQVSDLVSGTSTVSLIYGYDNSDGNSTTDETRDKTDMQSSTCAGYWNREHIFPKSLATPALDTDSAGSGTDLHNLRAADCQMNSTRNNNLYEDSSGNAALTTNGFYPGDDYRGDVARAIMYMYLRYPTQALPNNVGYGNNYYHADVPDVLLEWNEEDPPSALEIQRNNAIETYQGNRNPFVDNPFLAYLIWGGPVISDWWSLSLSPRITINSSSSVSETNSSFNTAISVTMSGFSSNVSLSFSANGSSTAENGDYTLNTSSPLTFTSNETQTISVAINNDDDNHNETIILGFTVSPESTNLVNSQHTISVADDEKQLIITEIADPNGSGSAGKRFVEIFNSSDRSVDLSDYKIKKWVGGGSSTAESGLSGTLASSEYYIVANSSSTFLSVYGFTPDQATSNVVSANGDDSYGIILVSDSSIVDLYGDVSVDGEGDYADGSGTDWEFEDGRAERGANATIPKSTWSSSEWSVENDTGGGDSTNNPQTAPDDYDPGYWIGATDTDTWTGRSDTTNTSWATADNWASGVIPAAGDKVFIHDATNDPDISTDITLTDLTVKASGVLDINSTGSLTLTGDFTNSSGTVNLNSAADHFPAIKVAGDASGNVTYYRYVNAVGDDEWDLIGSPVDGLSISSFATTNTTSSPATLATNGSQYAIGVYDNSVASGHADEWINYTNSGSGWQAGNFDIGKGYAMASVSGGTGLLAFTGTIPTTDQTQAIIDNSSSSGRRWNLIANPFPSFVNANDDADGSNNFLTVNTSKLDDEFESVYGYDADGSGYTGYGHDYLGNTAIYIAPGQGFMVASDDAGSDTVSFTEAMQSVSGQDDFIDDVLEETSALFLRLYHGDDNIEETKIKFQENMTAGLDPGYDLGNYYQGAAIMTRLLEQDQGTGFQDQQLPLSLMDGVVIPLVINQTAGQEFRVNLHTSTIGEVNIYLEDTELETLTLLNEQDFVLTPTSDLSDVGRFYIHMTADTLSDGEVNTSLLNAYKEVDQNYITIEGLATQSTNTGVSLYNILGTKVMDAALDNTLNTQMISTNGLSTGIYVIKLESGVNQLTKKLIIK